MKPRYVVIDYPCSDQIIMLKRNKIIEMVHGGMDAIVARYGTNIKTLRKILKDEQGEKNG